MSADGETGDGIDTNVVQSLVARRMFDPDAELYRIGRFAVLERLGTGGMGVVYGAYDPELDRRVAVKLLFDDGDDGGRAAAVREAQAMARLADPNVAAVYEVGIHKGRTFVAMQHVRGQNLRRWAQAQPRALPEILAVYRQAALGLAAAHEVGVVHRDFKPDNALVDDDGRVRVVDFGLASIDAGLRTPSEAASLGDPEHESTDPLTARRGGGTPAYMAAEQFGGEPGDARCDQFAWCVSLWEACVGARPFAGHDFASLVAAVRDDRILEPPPRRLPRWLAKLLRRGLAAEPGARYRDMRQLVA
ncbi:MAG TPA: serine/threonine-protein kinase, partial [Nannocystaceae bacterium]|nr:serine/threonine-protein kinase [Nannocystaceae bacterium]